MIKLFRKIRQNLLSEGKTGKYLKYAIGEIILVVIGILIALQVNNWNEQRKFNNLKSIYIEGLLNDLRQDTVNINLLINDTDKKQLVIKSLINELDTEKYSEKLFVSVEGYFRSGWSMSDFTVNKNTYSDLSKSGNMNVFQDNELSKKIKNYYVAVEQEEKGRLTNKDWIIPMDVVLASETNAFDFDANTKELFQNNHSTIAMKNLLDNKSILKRNAAGHYWFNKSLKRGIIDVNNQAVDLINTLQTELQP